jgi:hypothetical protein
VRRGQPGAQGRIAAREAMRTDLGLVAALAVVALAVVVAVPASVAVLRLPAALALILVLPGYALASAIVGELRPAERVLLSLVLSITATIIVALALELVGAHLTTTPWMGLLAAVTVAAAATAVVRGDPRPVVLPRVRLGFAQISALAAAVALLGGAAALGFTPLGAPKGTQGSTALWICARENGCKLPSNAVEVGVISDQLHATRWRVRVLVAGRSPRSFGPITLAPGATWSHIVATGAGAPVVRAFLYSTGRPSTAYRSVVLRYGRASATTLRRAGRTGRVAVSVGGGP